MKPIDIKSPLLFILAIILVVLINSCVKGTDCKTCTARYTTETITRELCSQEARDAFEGEHPNADVSCQ
jgi:hypothetical protein